MADTLRIKRRASGGAAGAPASLAAAEIAYNEQDDTLYYGWGNSSGSATVVKPIAGPGAFAPLNSPALTGNPTAPTPAAADNDTSIATTAFVTAAVAASGGGGGASVSVGDTPPGSPTDNSLWWESDSGVLYIRYNDGGSTQWVQVSGQEGPPGPPISPTSDVQAHSAWLLGADAFLYLSKSSSGANFLQGAIGTLTNGSDYKARWDILLGNGEAETGSNAGTNFQIQSYADDGTTVLPVSLNINRASGLITVKGDPTAALGVATKQYVDLRAPLASPVFTGDPQAPTPATADNDTSIATTAWVKAQYRQNSVVFDPPSAATGVVGVIQTLTVTGAALGDFCVASFSVDLNGMTLLAWVSATNTVKFQFQNKTAGTLDLASGTVRVRVWKQ